MVQFRPTPIVISAPSGTGKTSIIKAAREIFPNLTLSVSYTTRAPREGEQNGVDYYFVDQASFKQMIDEDAFLEWAEVHGNYYGTSIRYIEEHQKKGYVILLDIDVQGAMQLMNNDNFRPYYIFIEPPSLETLESRLRNRQTDSEEKKKKRLSAAQNELSHADKYNTRLLNDDLDRAVNEFVEIAVSSCLSDIDSSDASNVDQVLQQMALTPDYRPHEQLHKIVSKVIQGM